MRALIGQLVVLGLVAGCAPSPREVWQTYTDEVRAAGSLRVERAPPDAPVDAARIAASFEAIAFTFESDPFARGENVDQQPMLRRWHKPISYALIAESNDLTRMRSALDLYVPRLETLTGLSISEISPQIDPDRRPNVFILFGRDYFLRTLKAYDDLLNAGITIPETERASSVAILADVVGGWYAAPSPCAGQVYIADGQEDTVEGEVLFAIVTMRSEIPDALLAACVEEELAQLLGLFNDADEVRPSIFNDDQEFALLTEHDGALLQILYDERLKTGMAPSEAMPIVRRIVSELEPFD